METQKITRSLTVLGMTCASCARIVERSLSRVEGVRFAAVNLATDTAFAVLDYDVPLEVLEAAVKKAGYCPTRERPLDAEQRRYERTKMNALLACLFMVPPMVFMAFHMMGHHSSLMAPVDVVFGAAAIFLAGRDTLKGAWIAVTHGHANMDVLVSLGALAAWATGLMTLAGVKVPSFGMTAPMIMALSLLGRFIESRLRDRAAREIRALLALQVKEARVINDGEELFVPLEALKVGQLVRILPGERIPADGEVESGSASVDEAMLTGEPIPVAKSQGDKLTGGSMLVSGQVIARVTHVGDESFLAQMIAIIQEAQGAKIPIQAFVDRVTGLFVPVVMLLAVTSAAFWLVSDGAFDSFLNGATRIFPWITSMRSPGAMALLAFLSTLLIACPCALGLATPMALIASTGAASRKGFIIRNAEAIQTLGQVSAAVLDKTGTLTLGRPVVVWHNLDEATMNLASAMESASSHPLAQAIAQLAPDAAPLEDVNEVAGEGLSAVVDGVNWTIGRPKSFEDLQLHLKQGRTMVELRRDGVVTGHIALEDPIRPEAAEAIAVLRKQGVEPCMATGDNEGAARRVALAVGIEKIYADVRPEDKLKLVRHLQSEGRKVLMVGDGINDAAALKGADVGVAVGSGSELAVDSADAVMVHSDATVLGHMVKLSQFTFTVIRQNLFWAFGYNLIALPLAMAALLHPVIAEGAMILSSISVIANSQRINRQ